MPIDEESHCQLLCSKSRDAHDDTETRTVCMSSFVEAYSQGHISYKDEVGVRAVMTNHLIGTSPHVPQHPMLMYSRMDTTGPGPHGLLHH
ncbi:hypothetical protein TNCV_2454381 [Trichonephila clavipes]|nr:hypothetical protein TNCV_2454381 [Trichonephila clavipes]